MMKRHLLVFIAILCMGVTAEFGLQLLGQSTCAMSDSSVKCWGSNQYGQSAIDDAHAPPQSPIDFGSDFEPIELFSGHYSSCVVSANGTSKCWGRNDYNQLGYGDTADHNEMGDALEIVDWGTGFKVHQICVLDYATCALSTDHDLKCVGLNDYGQLGLGNSVNSATDATGDAIASADLGTDFEPESIYCGGYAVCALSGDGTLKCWGDGRHGLPGRGDTEYRGDDADEMGDYLLPIDLGTNFTLMKLSCGGYHCCALSPARDLKCWGYNEYGQLGYGDTNRRGDAPDEMGDYLPIVDWGTNFTVKDVECAMRQTCVLSMAGTVKCVGWNNYGQMGDGTTSNVGDDANEIGDFLPIIDFGTNFIAHRLFPMSRADHECISNDDGMVKCWGRGTSGELGYNDTENRGDNPGEMGDNLPFLDFGFTIAPTTDPTSSPTNDPTSSPTTQPTVSPTADPTSYPTSIPSEEPTADPTGEPTGIPTATPSAGFETTWDSPWDLTGDSIVTTSSAPLCEDQRDALIFWVQILYGIIVGLGLIVLLLLLVICCLCCCRKEGGGRLLTVKKAEEERDLLPNGGAQNIRLDAQRIEV